MIIFTVGSSYLYGYYNKFSIDIINYVEYTEVFYTFLPFVITLFTIGISFLYSMILTEKMQTVKTPIQKESPWYVRNSYRIAFIAIAVLILVITTIKSPFRSQSFFGTLAFLLRAIAVLFPGSLSDYMTGESWILHRFVLYVIAGEVWGVDG